MAQHWPGRLQIGPSMEGHVLIGPKTFLSPMAALEVSAAGVPGRDTSRLEPFWKYRLLTSATTQLRVQPRKQPSLMTAISGVALPCLARVTDLRTGSIRSRYCRKRRLQAGNSNTFVHSPVVNHQTSVCVGFKEYQGRWLIFSSWLLQSGLSLIVHAAWLQF